MEKYLFLAMTVCAAVGFAYGLYRFFRKQSALYIRMIVFGIGCAMLGRLFQTLQLFVSGGIQEGFHVGILGVVGSFMFFFSANYGQIDSLVDDGGSKLRKYRLLALLAPLAAIALYAVYYIRVGFCADAAVHGVETAFIGAALYFHLKHLIIPDVHFGIVRSIRSYNLLALIYGLLCMTEIIFGAFRLPGVCNIVLSVLLCLTLIVFIPVLEKGAKKWSI